MAPYRLIRDDDGFVSLSSRYYWLRPPTGLCAGGKQTVGYMQGVVNRLMPHHHHPPPPPHPNRPLLYNRWLRQRGLGPNAAFCIGIAATFIAKKGRVAMPQARARGNMLLSAPKLSQFKGAAAKTGVPPEGNILLY